MKYQGFLKQWVYEQGFSLKHKNNRWEAIHINDFKKQYKAFSLERLVYQIARKEGKYAL